MRRLSFGVMLISLAALAVELMLTRALDVVLAPTFSYLVVSTAVFGFGLAGVYATLRPVAPDADTERILVRVTAALALSIAIIVPAVNHLTLDYLHLGHRPVVVGGSFLILYLVLIAPFFLAGYALIAVFSTHARRIQRLYFWDLAGAGIGTVAVVPLIEPMGPGGVILCAAAVALAASALFAARPAWRAAALLAALGIVAVPVVHGRYIDFAYQIDKRGIATAIAEGRGELTRWDPISKIDVIDETWSPAIATPWHRFGNRKALQYDGGNQSSYFYQFDGDLKKLRRHLDHDLSDVSAHFWQLGVLAGEYAKRDSGQSVLVIGSAGGQETKAALLYGASHVDAVELVPTVVRLGLGRYAHYIGDIFHDPRVSVRAGEGRSFLRHSPRRYDIIQIYSNYTSSSIAQGNGAMEPEYLETAEAYEEYFAHLAPDGILQVNHYAYPRLITTAALAWKRMGRTDFARHVAVFTCPNELTLPTVLIKMSPWTPAEIASLSRFLAPAELDPKDRLRLVENPVDPAGRFLSPEFYSGDFPESLASQIPADLTPRTDDDPYYGMLRKSMRRLTAGKDLDIDPGTAYVVDSAVQHGIPMELIHLVLLGGTSLVLACLFVLVPLRFSAAGRAEGARAAPLMIYFSCLGAGFITFELVLIQKYMQVIGSPLFTYTTVIFTMLLAAGLGSAASERLGIGPRKRWAAPFVGVIAIGAALIGLYPRFAEAVLALSMPARVALSALTIFPLGFFLGMPFPIGVLALVRHPRGAIAWAWGMNGLTTVVGGLTSVVISVLYGFDAAVGSALLLYGIAAAVFVSMRDVKVPAAAEVWSGGNMPSAEPLLERSGKR